MTDKEKKKREEEPEEHTDLGEVEGQPAEDSIYGIASEGGALVGGIYGKGVDSKEAAKHHEGDYLDSGPDQGIVGPCDTEKIDTESGADVGSPEDADEAEEETPTPEQYVQGGGTYSGGRGTTGGEKP